jgi:hypothetical protein
VILTPFGNVPRALDDDARKEIGKAVVIAGLSTLVTEGVKLGFEDLREWLKRRRAGGSTP